MRPPRYLSLIITSCKKCPYLETHYDWDSIEKDYTCKRHQRHIKNIDEIPDWCELPGATGHDEYNYKEV